MSWTEPLKGGRFAVRFAVGTTKGWSKAQTVASGDDLLANWADFSSVIVFKDGTLAVHWLRMHSDKSYAYDVNIAMSKDSGATWSQSIVPHRDGTTNQHGFVSLLPLPDMRLFMIWLDGRQSSGTEAAVAGKKVSKDVMQLRFATLGKDGGLSQRDRSRSINVHVL